MFHNVFSYVHGFLKEKFGIQLKKDSRSLHIHVHLGESEAESGSEYSYEEENSIDSDGDSSEGDEDTDMDNDEEGSGSANNVEKGTDYANSDEEVSKRLSVQVQCVGTTMGKS